MFGDDTKGDNTVRIIKVNDIDTYKKPILKNGGELTVPEIVLSNNNKIIYYTDPGGNIFALFQNYN